ncbi:Malolactic regulator [Lacticaseibacillus rhamnosus]|uniref:Malolactic regulator n=1 Tax=Lacticaseibacillus rhamnosus TaxID=47715 RepID=A0AAX0K0N3_LACRH|nr:Malolactic regulator [Lacticaseibacillus rhamnosus]AXI95855.1 Malolactic regulator [Lacticaseibacillus rhamnosus GG]ART97373.1 Malolactic regulator [Lacticaseibacillus rhamnosus]AZZ24524.1 Malolactic regulator [Lacticaseibacillus rhamnosus]MCT3192586.1 Malolactic regulator [Lacticaseibacillus rhamnosus]
MGSACEDFRRNGHDRGIASEAACVLAYAHNALTGAGICV